MKVCKAGGDAWACGRSSDRYPLTKGLCKTHYMQSRRGRGMAPIDAYRATAESRMCGFGECGRAVSARGLCTAHYQQRSKGQPLSPLRPKRANGAVREMVERGIVECLGCGLGKPRSDFSAVNASGAPRPYCKPCNSERVRLNNYKVTREFVSLLARFQQDRCAVCRRAHTGGKAMHLDHDHACCAQGSCGDCVRGLVCNNCNLLGLAWYEALPLELRTFALLNDYLADPPAKRLRAAIGAAGG